jgi:hypothetical protein
MDLPFVVDSTSTQSSQQLENSIGLGADDSSLVTASSQGSLLPNSEDSADNAERATTAYTNDTGTDAADPVTLGTGTSDAPLTTAPARDRRDDFEDHLLLATPADLSVPNVEPTSHRLGSIGSVLSQLGLRGPTTATPHAKHNDNQNHRGYAIDSHRANDQQEEEVIDFTYVNVWDTDADEVDILLSTETEEDDDRSDPHPTSDRRGPERGDILAALISGTPWADDSTAEDFVVLSEQANRAAAQAIQAKRRGNLQEALDAHATAAKLFREAAGRIQGSNGTWRPQCSISANATSVQVLISPIGVRMRLSLLTFKHTASMTHSLLLLSQTQARSALALKRAVKLRPSLSRTNRPNSDTLDSQTDRLRATVRGALNNRREADISDSVFLGSASNKDSSQLAAANDNAAVNDSSSEHNPVDEMLELERELKNMDMALELGNSIASLDTRTQNRMKSSMIDGSFMVIPPGSQYHSLSSSTRNPAPAPRAVPNRPAVGASTARARANRVQTRLEASVTRPATHVSTVPPPGPPFSKNQSLESSWWGSSVAASQVLTSSVVSLASGMGGGPSTDAVSPSGNQPANTKQLMRLMDSLKALGDENAALMREVEGAEAARTEAKVVKQQMQHFKEEYRLRFDKLKETLERFRKGQTSHGLNPVLASEFGKTANSETVQQQEGLIRKLTADLQKEKEESKRKDAALKKYESFYLEVKARSAQKQRQREAQQRQARAGVGTPPLK